MSGSATGAFLTAGAFLTGAGAGAASSSSLGRGTEGCDCVVSGLRWCFSAPTHLLHDGLPRRRRLLDGLVIVLFLAIVLVRVGLLLLDGLALALGGPKRLLLSHRIGVEQGLFRMTRRSARDERAERAGGVAHRPLLVKVVEVASPEILRREGEEGGELVLLGVALSDQLGDLRWSKERWSALVAYARTPKRTFSAVKLESDMPNR